MTRSKAPRHRGDADRLLALLASMSVEEKLAQLRAVEADEGRPQRAADLLAPAGHRRRTPTARRPPSGTLAAAGPVPPLHIATAWPVPRRADAAWPAPLGLAASWDRELVAEAGAAAAAWLRRRHFHAVHVHALTVTRDPRLGCVECGFGESAALTAALGGALIAGLQREPPGGGAPLIAIAGDFAGPALPRPGETVGPTPVAPRELRTAYLPPYEAAVRARQLLALRASRAEVDALPCHADRALLTGLLRDDWRFDGVVYAERHGVDDLHRVYRVSAGREQAALDALLAGVDVALDAATRTDRLAAAVRDGRLPLARLDEAVLRVLALKQRAGLFAAPRRRREAAPPPSVAAARAARAAERSIVLLKNEREVLPLAPASSPPRVAVVGAAGDADAAAFTAALRRRGGRRIVLLADAARATQRSADTVVVAGRAATPARLRALSTMGIRPVVVLFDERPSLAPEVAEAAGALLAAWGSGARGPAAAAAIVLGDASPGGRLPLTLARHAGQLPSFHDVKPSARRGYLFDSAQPLFEFGAGLGYGRLAFDPPRLSVDAIAADGHARLQVTVRNIGAREVDVTVQLYVRPVQASVTQPLRRLLDFQRLSIAAGRQRTVRFTIDARRDLPVWDARMRHVVEPGAFELLVGPDPGALQAVTLTVAAGAAR